LRRRLITRATDSDEIIEKRMKEARDIISHYHEYEYVIVNDNLNVAFEEICALIDAKRLKNIDTKALREFVDKL